MKFSDYVKIKKYASLSTTEALEFGIVDFTKGWVKRYSNNTANEGVLQRLVNSDDVSQMTKVRIKAFVKSQEKQIKRKISLGKKYLYLVKNELGRYKIGISEDPVYRAKTMSTASGYYCNCLCYWDLLGDSPTKIEAEMFRVFRRNRVLGEWFNEDLNLNRLFKELSGYEITNLE